MPPSLLVFVSTQNSQPCTVSLLICTSPYGCIFLDRASMALLYEREFPAVADEDRPNLLSIVLVLVLLCQSFVLLSIIIVTYMYIIFTTGIYGYSDSS